MKSFAVALLISASFTSVASACGGYALRCVNPNGPVNDDYDLTLSICNSQQGDMCWCYKWAEHYCSSPDNSDFISQCASHGGFAARECQAPTTEATTAEENRFPGPGAANGDGDSDDNGGGDISQDMSIDASQEINN